MCVKAQRWTIWAAALVLACTSSFAQDESPADLPLEESAEDLDIVLQRHLWIDQEALSDEFDGWGRNYSARLHRDRLGVLATFASAVDWQPTA